MSGASTEADWSFLKSYPARSGYYSAVIDHTRERIGEVARGRPTKAQLQSILEYLDEVRGRIEKSDAELADESAQRRREIDQCRRNLGMAPYQWEAPR